MSPTNLTLSGRPRLRPRLQRVFGYMILDGISKFPRQAGRPGQEGARRPEPFLAIRPRGAARGAKARRIPTLAASQVCIVMFSLLLTG